MIKQSQKTRKSAERKVRIIAAFRKANGTIKAQVKNDEEMSYFVTVSSHGTMCRRWDGKECTGHYYTGHCYHVSAIQQISHLLGEEGISVQDSKTVQSVAAYLAYEALASQKQQALEEEKRRQEVATSGIRKVLAEREEHDAAGIASDSLTSSMNDPEKLEAQKDELTRERQRDLGERGTLSSNRGFNIVLNK